MQEQAVSNHYSIYFIAVGTPYYFSPELCRGEEYTEKCDIWSLGWIVYEMWCRKKPFEAENLEELTSKITQGFFEPISKVYSNSLSKLIEKMLSINPQDRPTADDILLNKAFQRHWIVLNLLKTKRLKSESRSRKQLEHLSDLISPNNDDLNSISERKHFHIEVSNKNSIIFEDKKSLAQLSAEKKERVYTPIRNDSKTQGSLSFRKPIMKSKIIVCFNNTIKHPIII